MINSDYRPPGWQLGQSGLCTQCFIQLSSLEIPSGSNAENTVYAPQLRYKIYIQNPQSSHFFFFPFRVAIYSTPLSYYQPIIVLFSHTH